ncbi:tubulin-like doman-containing protein [Dactylosporangium sp. NPDC048998]|uniref:tubulin-like doman-containing protein n=1 Tax=Dactylosporangium sp. NPDC048998 TaxID=3363976 RepID=UPI003716044D
MQRFLFIGVGGSGGETLRYLHQELTARLRRVGIPNMPSGWQFMHVDASLVSEESPDLPAQQRQIAYKSLVVHRLTYGVVSSTLQPSAKSPDTEYAGWLPPSNQVNVSVQHGAGQFRAIGRALALYRKDVLHEDLKILAQRLDGHEALDSLARVNAALRGEPIKPEDAADPIVIVVSSLAGGTGSGAFLDICDILRSLEQTWAGDSTALLYAPDVFQSLSQDKRQGIQANALAAVSELVAGYWNTTHVSDDALKPKDESARRGPARSLLVGSGNEALSFEEQREVFSAVGRTLAAWAMSPAIQQQYIAYIWGNWQQAATGKDPLGLMDGQVEAPFSALGYSSVGLGRDTFHRYAAQCLGRLAAERLLYGAGGAAVDEPTQANQRGQRIDRAWPQFVAGLGLDSQGERVAGALLDALAPPRDTTVLNEREAIRTRMRDATQPLTWWRDFLRARIGERRPQVLARQREQLLERASKWAPAIEEQLAARIEQVLLIDGLPVAVGLVERLRVYVRDDLAQVLEAEAMSDTAEADRYADEIDRALGEEPRHMLRRRPDLFAANNQRVESALATGAEAALGRAGDAQTRRTVAGLLRDLDRHLLEPLAVALGRGLELLRRDTVPGADGRPSVVSQWPAEPAFTVPAALQPTPNQFLIDPVEGYPAQLEALLRASATGAEDPWYYSLKQVLRGEGSDERALDGKPVDRRLVARRRAWRPELAREWSNSAEAEQTAVIEVHTTADVLLERALRWCGDDQHALGGFIHQSLQRALGGESPSPAEHERLGRFESAFTAAVRASAPLVRIDPAYAKLVPGYHPRPPQPLMTAIPLAEGTEAYRVAMRVLTSTGVFTDERALRQFDAAGPGQIEMATFLDRPHHHAAFQSLTRPILEDWDMHRRSGRTVTFSHWRRARSLPGAVPLNPEARLALVRGYFVALADDALAVPHDGQPISVRLDDGTTATFPDPLLGPPVEPDDPFDCLGGLLESLPLAFVGATINVMWLRAYQRLTEIGRKPRAAVGAKDLVPVLKDLKEYAVINYPLGGAPVAKRGWELRRDIHEALDRLLSEFGERL